MDGYKLPPKKPIRRSRRGVSKSNDEEDEGLNALRKKAQYDAMMAEIESEGSDEDLKDVRKFTARSGGFGRRVGNDDDLKKALEIDQFGKPPKIATGSWGDESDHAPARSKPIRVLPSVKPTNVLLLFGLFRLLRTPQHRCAMHMVG